MSENTVTKSGFIDQLVKRYGYTKSSATSLVEDFWSAILDNLEDGRAVYFYGLGCFDLLERAERICRNPQDNEQRIRIAAHYVPRFYPGNAMKRAVKKWEDDAKRGRK